MAGKRIYGDISPEHESKFLTIKGAFSCKNNGEALEVMIDKVMPLARKEVASQEKAKHRG